MTPASETAAVATTAAPAETAATIEAQARVAAAEGLFEAGNYDGALAEFERAHALMADDPRRHALLNNIAVCHERAFRYDTALQFYRRYLTEGPIDPVDRAQVEAVVKTLSSLLGRLSLDANVSAEVWIDGRHVGRAPGELLVPGGRHVIELRAPRHEARRLEVVVPAHGRTRVAVTLPRLPGQSTRAGLPPTYFYAGLGITGAALLGAGLLSAMTLEAQSDARALARASMGLQTPDTLDAEATTRDWALATDVSLGVTALLAATTLVVYLLTDFDERPGIAAVAYKGRRRSGMRFGQGIVLGGAFE